MNTHKISGLPNPACLKQADGFSLIEVLISVFILVVGLLSVARLLTMTIGLDALARSKSTAALAAQNELERLSDLYRQNPAAEELTIGSHQAEKLIEMRDPSTQNVRNMYKLTWSVSGIADPRHGADLPGRIISVRATPMLTENVENTHSFQNKTITLNAVIAADPR